MKYIKYLLPLFFLCVFTWTLVPSAHSTAFHFGGAAPGSTPTPISVLQLSDGATFQLRMNDAASCSTIVDTGGGSHNATVHGGVTCGVTGGGADGATAASFNGSTGWLSAAPATYAYPFTIEFAVNWSTINTGGLWDMNPGVGGTRDINCGVGAVSGGDTATVLGFGPNTCWANSYNTGQWVFWDVVYASASINVYMNGLLVAQRSASSGTYAQGATIGIGSINSGSVDFLAGSLQNYAIFPVGLTQAQAKKHSEAYFGT